MTQRLTYLRDGAPRSVTFGGDLAQTAEFVEIWEGVTGCLVLTCKPEAPPAKCRKVEGPPSTRCRVCGSLECGPVRCRFEGAGKE